MSARRWIPLLALTAALAAPVPAAACGGCFSPPTAVQVVTDHRMVLSLSRERTVLWDQFRYTGRPEEFSWILPIRNGPSVVVEAAENVFLTAMDDVSAPLVNPPPSRFRCQVSSGGGCGFSSRPALPSTAADDGSGRPTVNVYNSTVVGPYQVTTLGGTDPMALRNWLQANGYAVPPAVAPILDFYVEQRMDFVAVRLRPGAEVTQMQPLRIVMPGYVPTLPLRMIGAGVADKVGLVLTVIAESRVEAMNFPNGEVRDADLVFDYDAPSSGAAADFLAQFNRINRANMDRVWLTESAARVDGGEVTAARSVRCSGGFGTTPPPECATAPTQNSDAALAFRPFGGAAFVTRLRADLNATALDRDLLLAASDRPERSRTYNYGTLRNDPCDDTRTGAEGCAAGRRSPRGGPYLAGLATLGLVVAARARRRRVRTCRTPGRRRRGDPWRPGRDGRGAIASRPRSSMKRVCWLLLLSPMACVPPVSGPDAAADRPEASPPDTPAFDAADVAEEARPDDASDARSDDGDAAPIGDACADLAPPRPLAPLSVARVSSHRPTLRWVLPAGVSGAAVEVCADRACATVEQRFDADGAAARPPEALAPGFHFWRLRGSAAGCVGREASPTWEFFVGRRDAGVDTSWGTRVDLNGDGRSDLVVGGIEATTQEGAAIPSLSIYFGPVADAAAPAVRLAHGTIPRVLPLADVNGDGFPDATAVSFQLGGASGPRVPDAGAYAFAAGVRTWSAAGVFFGATVPTSAGAGDVNGDGYGDVVALDGDGLAVVKLGGPMGFTPSSTLAVPVFSVTTGWDVNHDGYADLVVSAREADTVGSVSVYPGGASGVSATPLQVLRGSSILGHDFGATMVHAGDLNGDGYADLAVSATIRSSALTGDFRRVHVYLGGAERLASEPAATLIGTTAYSAFADIMAPAGDVDGDGYDDLLVRGSRGASDDGYVYLYHGGPTGLRSGGATMLSAPCEDGYFGISLGGGDLDRDGYDDVIVGQPGMSASPGCNGGRVVVFAGGATGVSSAPRTTLRAPENPLRPALYVRDRFGQALGGLQ